MRTIPVLEKLPLDVHWDVKVHHASTVSAHMLVAIVTPSKDASAHEHEYSSIEDLTKDGFDEGTEVYRNFAAMKEVPGFNKASVQVIEYPTGASKDVKDVKASNGSFNESASGSIVSAVEDRLDDQALYVVPTLDVAKDDVIALANALYDDRGGAVVYQTEDSDAMHAVSTAIIAHQPKGSNGNILGIFAPSNLYEAAQVAAYLSLHVPMDAIKVGDLSEFNVTANTDEARDAFNAGFNVIENKSDMLMMSSGKAINGDYLDQYVDVKFVIDSLTRTLQLAMNRLTGPFNQSAIDSIKLAVKSEATSLYKRGVFMDQPVIQAPNYSEVSEGDLANRTYSGLKVSGRLFNAIDKFRGLIDVTE